MDTSTVRLVIFLGMFLVFAGDYTYLVSTIFGKPYEQNLTEPMSGPRGPPKEAPRDRIPLISANKEDDRENGKGNETRRSS